MGRADVCVCGKERIVWCKTECSMLTCYGGYCRTGEITFNRAQQNAAEVSIGLGGTMSITSPMCV